MIQLAAQVLATIQATRYGGELVQFSDAEMSVTNVIELSPQAAPYFPSVPVEPYVSEAHYRMEQERIFKRCWLHVGSVHEIPNPGDYAARTIEVLGLSLLLVRGRDKQIRAFHNVCMHRGNQLVHDGCSSARGFFCNVHGWTFDLQGKLTAVPPNLTFEKIDKASRGLAQLSVDTWQGFIFINMQKNPPETLRDYLGDVARFTDNHPLIGWDRIGRYSMDAACNWKTFQVSFMESSHVKTVHRRTIRDYAKEVVQPHFTTLGRHSNMTFYTNFHHSPHPVEELTIQASPGFMMKSDRTQLPGLNRWHRPNWMFDLFVVFPNFLLFLGDGWATSHVFWPKGVNRTFWESCYYAEPAQRPSQAIANHYFSLKLRDTVREDLEAVEAMQRGLQSGAVADLMLCQEETLIGHLHAVAEHYLHSPV